MPNCRNCSAPLPAGTIVCAYCGTREDVDLAGIHEYTVIEPASPRTCPRCASALATIDLRVGRPFLIERCDACLGLFFDPGELEALLDMSVQHVYEIDYRKIDAINQSAPKGDQPVGYVKCPVCSKIMNRINFGQKSGVVVDRCRDHGVWLDGGELLHLMEWTKAGGQLLHQQMLERKAEAEKRERERARREQETPAGYVPGVPPARVAAEGEMDLLGLLVRAAASLFH